MKPLLLLILFVSGCATTPQEMWLSVTAEQDKFRQEYYKERLGVEVLSERWVPYSTTSVGLQVVDTNYQLDLLIAPWRDAVSATVTIPLINP